MSYHTTDERIGKGKTDSETERPNILVILTDQQRADSIHALGNPVIMTPVLDRLVATGTTFTHAYSPSPVCVPARACLHYGAYPGKTGCFGNQFPMPSDPQMPSFMHLLTGAGYRTHGIGKCHFQPDSQSLRGFQTRESQEEVPQHVEDDDYLTFLQQSSYRHVRDPQGVRAEMVYMPQTSPLPESMHPTTWVADCSVGFVEKQAGKAEPWFLFSSFIHPHPPYAPPSPWDRLYRSADMPTPYLPDDYRERQPSTSKKTLYPYHFEGDIPMPLWQTMKARYYSCVSFVDYNIGRITEALRVTGQLDNTLIIFASDHGDMLGDLGLIGKCLMNEASARVPLIMSWPGKAAAGLRINASVSLVDIAPTLLEAAGVTTPPHMDGISLLHDISDDRIVFSQYGRDGVGEYMALDKDCKYIYSACDNREYFYDLMSDPNEDRNLLGDPKWASEETRLREALLNYLEETGQVDVFDPSSRRWKHWEFPEPPKILPRNERNNPWADYTIKAPGYARR